MPSYELTHFKKMVRVRKTKSLLFCLRYDPLIVFRRQNHITFIFIKTMSHDLLVQMAYSLRYRNCTEITVLMCEQKPYSLRFLCWPKSYLVSAVKCEHIASGYIAGEQRSPQPILCQWHSCNCMARFFPISVHIFGMPVSYPLICMVCGREGPGVEFGVCLMSR